VPPASAADRPKADALEGVADPLIEIVLDDEDGAVGTPDEVLEPLPANADRREGGTMLPRRPTCG
jgi:hypothetical protein